MPPTTLIHSLLRYTTKILRYNYKDGFSVRIICNYSFFQNVLSILTPISSVHFKCNMEISQRTFKFLLKKNFDLKTMSTVLFVSKSVPRGPYKRM